MPLESQNMAGCPPQIEQLHTSEQESIVSVWQDIARDTHYRGLLPSFKEPPQESSGQITRALFDDVQKFVLDARVAFSLKETKEALTDAHIPLSSISADSIKETAERSRIALQEMNDMLSKRSPEEVGEILRLANYQMEGRGEKFGYDEHGKVAIQSDHKNVYALLFDTWMLEAN